MKPPDAIANPPVTSARRTAGQRGRAPRADRRVPYRVPCRIRLVDPATGEVRTVTGETVNISTGGMALQLPVDAPVGTWIETLILHSSGEPLFLSGTVTHSRRTMADLYEVGVETDRPRPFI